MMNEFTTLEIALVAIAKWPRRCRQMSSFSPPNIDYNAKLDLTLELSHPSESNYRLNRE